LPHLGTDTHQRLHLADAGLLQGGGEADPQVTACLGLALLAVLRLLRQSRDGGAGGVPPGLGLVRGRRCGFALAERLCGLRCGRPGRDRGRAPDCLAVVLFGGDTGFDGGAVGGVERGQAASDARTASAMSAQTQEPSAK
jgi:hypothetical protein